MIISPYGIPPSLAALITLGVGIFVLKHNIKSKINILFFNICVSTAVWLGFLGLNLFYEHPNSTINDFLLRADYSGVVFVAISVFHFLVKYLEINNQLIKLIVQINYLFGVLIVVLIWTTKYILADPYKYFYGFYPQAGPYHPLFLIYDGLLNLIALTLLFQNLKSRAPKTEKSKQTKYLLTTFSIIFLGNIEFIPNYGVEIYPCGFFPVLIFILLISYLIIKHKIMDINIVFNRSLVYSILITTLTIIYLLFVILVERMSQNFFRYNSIVVSILSAIIIAIIFVPLKDQIQKLVDRLFLKKTPFELVNENQLLRQNAADSEKMRTIATLASGVAHEIRNPLTALKTFVEYFPKKKNDPEFIAKFEKIAGSEICRIESILNDLLAFAKPSPLTLTDTNIKCSLEHALNLTTNQLSKNNVEVKTELSDDIPTIKADSNKLLQVFINLIINANDAMQNGGTLTITASCDESISISISDTGCGIEPKDLAKIFDPFFSTKEKGTGLGLAIVKGIIEDHGGKIAVKSVQMQGTIFQISLPSISQIKRTNNTC